MGFLKFLALLLLGLMIVTAGIQTLQDLAMALGMALAVIDGAAAAVDAPYQFGRVVGRLTVSLVILVLCVWGFRKLSKVAVRS